MPLVFARGRVKTNSIPCLPHTWQQFDILGYIYAMTSSAAMNNIPNQTVVQRPLYAPEHTTVTGLYSVIQHMPQNIHCFMQRLDILTEESNEDY